MEILPLTRTKMPKKVIIKSLEDFESLDIGDLTPVTVYFTRPLCWRVYEGNIKGKGSFIKQNPLKPTQIISYRAQKENILTIEKGILIPSKEIEVCSIGEPEYCYKMGLLMAAGLWRNLVDLK